MSAMTAAERTALRTAIGNLPMASHLANYDNLTIALAMYYESLPGCPDDDTDPDFGWSSWALEMADAVLDRIIDFFEQEKEQPV